MRGNGKFSSIDDDDDEEDANWMDSYSDLVTDLLAVFVILFSFAMASQSVIWAQSNANVVDPMIATESSSQNSLIESINNYIQEAGLSDQISVSDQGDNTILVRAESSVFFGSAEAEINADSQAILKQISKIFDEYSDDIEMVRIEGHTDNRPIKNAQFPSNWELSTSRAVNVLKYLTKITELEPNQLSAVGYGEYHPIAENNSNDNRAKNRRVDFIIETVSQEEQPQQEEK